MSQQLHSTIPNQDGLSPGHQESFPAPSHGTTQQLCNFPAPCHNVCRLLAINPSALQSATASYSLQFYNGAGNF